MKKILFPTDFSNASLNAFAYALDLADATGSEIITLHVYQLPVLDYDGVPPYLLETYDVFELGSFENFRDQVPALRDVAAARQKQHVPVRNVLLEGDLVTAITDLVKEESVDLVVMGTKGASGLEEIFLGTTTARVMAAVDIAVIAIPEAAAYKPIRKIGFATELHDDDRRRLERVITIAQSLGATVECLHVQTPQSIVSDVLVADWELVFQGRATFTLVGQEDVEQAILDFCSTHAIDMMAMVQHKRGFFEGLFHRSRTKQLAYHSDVPLLALK
ncbi:MAG TPA: universal stress protein [Flavobacterium sp.]|nr:universal stress protein [Flavobacterium sp.]